MPSPRPLGPAREPPPNPSKRPRGIKEGGAGTPPAPRPPGGRGGGGGPEPPRGPGGAGAPALGPPAPPPQRGGGEGGGNKPGGGRRRKNHRGPRRRVAPCPACAPGGGLVVLRDTGLATVPITLVGLTTAVAVVVGRARHRPTVTFPWTMFALACVAFIVGAGLRQALDGQPIAPLADVFSLSGYAAMFIAFVALLRNRRADGAGPHELIDGVIVCVAAASAALVFLALPVVDTQGWSAFTVLLGAYPVIDVAVVFVAVLLYWTSANRVVAFWLLAVTMTAMLVGDIGYAYIGTHGRGRRLTAARPAVRRRLRVLRRGGAAPLDGGPVGHPAPPGAVLVARAPRRPGAGPAGAAGGPHRQPQPPGPTGCAAPLRRWSRCCCSCARWARSASTPCPSRTCATRPRTTFSPGWPTGHVSWSGWKPSSGGPNATTAGWTCSSSTSTSSS